MDMPIAVLFSSIKHTLISMKSSLRGMLTYIVFVLQISEGISQFPSALLAASLLVSVKDNASSFRFQCIRTRHLRRLAASIFSSNQHQFFNY
jgi:hypothetical protein